MYKKKPSARCNLLKFYLSTKSIVSSLPSSFKKIKGKFFELSWFPHYTNTLSSEQTKLVGSPLACKIRLHIRNFLWGRLGQHC